MIDELRATMTAFPGCRGLGVAHAGAVIVPAGWRHIENLTVGYDDGSVVLEHPDASRTCCASNPIHMDSGI